MIRITLFSAIAIALAVPARADVRHVKAGDNLQAAINAARPGDEIRLEAGATFLGNFVLPAVSGGSLITIRTDLPDAELPAPNQRVTPATAASFATIQSPNTGAALRTARGAHHWQLLCLQFANNQDGYGDIIQLGDGSAGQSDPSQVPYEIVLDRLYVHGSPTVGQKRGIALNAATVTIRNCHISDIKAVGADAQAIGGWNGPGPYSIENNFLEASGEVMMFGGSDPYIANLVPSDVAIRYNLLTRPMAWRDPIVPAPDGGSGASANGGALPAGTYTYRVVARRPVGQGNTGHSAPSAPISVAASGGSVTLTWAPVEGATEYQVFGRSPAAQNQYLDRHLRELHRCRHAGKVGHSAPGRVALGSEEHLRAEERAPRAGGIQHLREQLEGGAGRVRHRAHPAQLRGRLPVVRRRVGGVQQQHRPAHDVGPQRPRP